MIGELKVLQKQIESRCASIVKGHNGVWPCRKGCGLCCTKMASVPLLTLAEWEQVSEGLAVLPEATQCEIRQRVAELAEGPIVCPFLDAEAQSCLVYEQRPVACRTYGFYVERDTGQYCGDILSMVDSGAAGDVVWGNAAAVEDALGRMGERRDLREWMR